MVVTLLPFWALLKDPVSCPVVVRMLNVFEGSNVFAIPLAREMLKVPANAAEPVTLI